MNNFEKLAILTALEKAVKDQIKIVRKDANDDLFEAHDSMGVEKISLTVNGQKVGNFIEMMTKDDYKITDHKLFDDFALCNGFASIKNTINPEHIYEATQIVKREAPELISEEIVYDENWKKYAEPVGDSVILGPSGVVIPGVEFVPEHPNGKTMVRGCAPKDVLPIVAQIGGIDQLLLGAGDE